VTALRRELGADPEPETTELYRDLLRSQAPAIAGPAVRGSPVAARPSETPLIGREAEMEYLRRALETAWDGKARATLVVGEAGAGKTRLVEELLAEAERLGGRTLFGRGYEGERVLPLRVWVEAIRTGQVVGNSAPSTLSSATSSGSRVAQPRAEPLPDRVATTFRL
jgi:MoxR-like ATPase